MKNMDFQQLLKTLNDPLYLFDPMNIILMNYRGAKV